MKRLLMILGTVILVVGGLAAPVLAQDESGVVTVTFQMGQIAVTVDPAAVSYGMVDLSANVTPVEPEPDPSIIATNNGTVWLDMYIRGADATNWFLADAPGVETYAHYFGTGLPGNVTYTDLTSDYQDLGPFFSYSPGAEQSFKLKMATPTDSVAFGLQETTVTVMVTMVGEGISLELVATPTSFPWPVGWVNLNATITDAANNPVQGLNSTQFSTRILGVGPWPFTFTEVAPGFYMAGNNITLVDPGMYTIKVSAWDYTSTNKTAGEDDLEMTPP